MIWKLNDNLLNLGKIFHKNGYSIYLVGGAVRNMVLGLDPKDYDLTTDATPEEVMRMFKRVIPTGIQHGTVTILFGCDQYEVTTFRSEGKYTDNRRPESIKYISDLNEDLRRRDFTINSMAIDLKDLKLYDPNSGLLDIKSKLIRAIGNPVDRFEEDSLRLMRACRFASQLGFSIESATLVGISNKASNIVNISYERIRDEFSKILLSQKPSYGLDLLRKTGILKEILPELFNCYGIKQNEYHRWDVYHHCLYSCDASKNILEIRLAVLFHDIGKVDSQKLNSKGRITFYNHELIGADIAKNILTRLKYPNHVINKVNHLIKHHMFNYSSDLSDQAIRRFISRVGIQNIDDLLELKRADIKGFDTDSIDNNINKFVNHINKVKTKDAAFTVGDLNITGNDLYEFANIPKNKDMGKILKELLDVVLDDPSQNYIDNLLKLAKEMYFKK
ncbi:CCA tRNA nucleotidyltransferase [Spirochaeta cellobiosiphila]|uniref:CCA tRNA nucleotidyltransferase n=1 Tax=Spirochaeta cellobiosiphila TaxID=504483 RepID=UPI0004099348|nr:CCA tRNA nucleotidyltransferase [Spirochaeta cellobiosiphila]